MSMRALVIWQFGSGAGRARLASFCYPSATAGISTLSLHDALPILSAHRRVDPHGREIRDLGAHGVVERLAHALRSEEHTSELQSRVDLVCRLLLEKKKWDTITQ